MNLDMVLPSPDVVQNLQTAARLVDDFDAQCVREGDAFREGFRIGWRHGYDVGAAHAEADMERHWKRCARSVRATAEAPMCDELHRLRYPWLYGEAS